MSFSMSASMSLFRQAAGAPWFGIVSKHRPRKRKNYWRKIYEGGPKIPTELALLYKL